MIDMYWKKILVRVCLTASHARHFGHLLAIIKIGDTRCQILWLKRTKLDFGWGSAPDPAGGLTALSHTPSWIKGAYF